MGGASEALGLSAGHLSAAPTFRGGGARGGRLPAGHAGRGGPRRGHEAGLAGVQARERPELGSICTSAMTRVISQAPHGSM